MSISFAHAGSPASVSNPSPVMTPPRPETHRPVGVNAAQGNEVIIGLSADSREQVDAMVGDAIAAGGQSSGDAVDHGQMYGRSFQDVDRITFGVSLREAAWASKKGE